MTVFGETLRAFRQASNDPNRFNKRLSQERLGELIGREMDDLGFSGAAVSDWERGQSKISVEDRKGILADVSSKIAGINTNIKNMEARTGDDAHARIDVTIEISDLKHLEKVIKSLRGVEGVLGVERAGRAGERSAG